MGDTSWQKHNQRQNETKNKTEEGKWRKRRAKWVEGEREWDVASRGCSNPPSPPTLIPDVESGFFWSWIPNHTTLTLSLTHTHAQPHTFTCISTTGNIPLRNPSMPFKALKKWHVSSRQDNAKHLILAATPQRPPLKKKEGKKNPNNRTNEAWV